VKTLAEAVGDSVGRDRLVPPMAGLAAGCAFFLNVRDFPVGAHFAIPTGHAPARQGSKAEESDEAHETSMRRVCKPRADFSSKIQIGTHREKLRVSRTRSRHAVPVRGSNPQIPGIGWMRSPTLWIRPFSKLGKRRSASGRYHECKQVTVPSVDKKGAHVLTIWYGP
jgi:hypothetical protein